MIFVTDEMTESDKMEDILCIVTELNKTNTYTYTQICLEGRSDLTYQKLQSLSQPK